MRRRTPVRMNDVDTGPEQHREQAPAPPKRCDRCGCWQSCYRTDPDAAYCDPCHRRARRLAAGTGDPDAR